MGERTQFSIFPRAKRPFIDSDNKGKDREYRAGMSLPDLIRSYYGVIDVNAISDSFSFLNRDDKEKEYRPAIEDQFVFSGAGSVGKFRSSGLLLLQHIVNIAKELGLPVKMDEDRHCEVIDTDRMDEIIDSVSKEDRSMWNVISFILSNHDIALKSCVVRGVNPCWWASSYSGKMAPAIEAFRPALNVFKQAVKQIRASDAYSKARTSTLPDLGDPLDTSVGYPYYTGQLRKDGLPITKVAVIDAFKRVNFASRNFDQILDEVDHYCPVNSLKGFPFAMAPLRRVQPGYKWNHGFNSTSFGYNTAWDFRGYNTVRIAWMAPYLLNLNLSPLQLDWKIIRKLLPGVYNGGVEKRVRMKMIREKKLYSLEADYSNYDRFIPVNLFTEISDILIDGLNNPEFYRKMVKSLHYDVSTIWPDMVPGSRGRGWIFKVPMTGLLSGLKITSEEGTFVNLIVTIQTCLDAKVMTPSQAVDYLTYPAKHDGNMPPLEYFFIQSDDNLLLHQDSKVLTRMGMHFKDLTAKAGLKGSLMLGDRFLMRHTADGNDFPVPMRVWQNTLSNESPPPDAIRFMVGLVTRTDGMLGCRTYDPFGLGSITAITRGQIEVEAAVLSSLLDFVQTSSSPVPAAVNFLQIMVASAESMLNRTKKGDYSATASIDSGAATRLSEIRKSSIMALVAAQRDLDPILGIDSWIQSLIKDRHIPSSALILESIMGLSPELAERVKNFASRENQFYAFAMNELGIPKDVLK